jgi:AcrR family transcriptional regulator
MPKLDEETQRARQENILNAAERCFSGQGFHSTSMQDICREAGISPGTLYLYFRSKEDLIEAICLRERAAFAQALTAIADAPDFMAALRQLADAYCLDQPHSKFCFQIEVNAEALRNPVIGKTVRESDAFIIDRFRTIIEEASAKGRIKPATDALTLAQILNIIGDGVFLRRAIDPDFNVKQCMDVILSLLSSAFQPVENDETGTAVPHRGEHETIT